MSTDFGALDALFSPGIDFTLKGTKYTIEPPSAQVGLWCERVAQVAGGVRAAETEDDMAAAVARIEALPTLDDGELTMAQRVLGDLYTRLVDDGINHAWIKLIANAAFFWIVIDEDAARRYIEAGGRPEAMAPNRAARRQSPATGGAAKTRKPASSSGTRSRKATTPAATRSRGKKS